MNPTPENNEMNFGFVVCQLVWGDRHRSTVKLPAIPPIGSILLMEDEADRLLEFVCVGVAITVKHMPPDLFRELPPDDQPLWANYVKILLEPKGEVSADEDNVLRLT